MSQIALIDCDEVLVYSGMRWLDWLNLKTDQNKTLIDVNFSYQLDDHFRDDMTEDPFSFWHCDKLYDNMVAIHNAKAGLLALIDAGFKIYIVTYCVGNHFSSKCRFIKKNFSGLYEDIIATKSKFMIKGDLIIDDRNEYLSKFCGEETFRVRMKSPFKQTVDFVPDLEMRNWDDIYKVIKEFKERK